jgi:glutamine phosphoribosylpyrophosphate amidotransferase
LTPVLPAHLCPVPGPLYTVLLGYKESAVDEARRRFTRMVHERFRVFFAAHRACIEAAIGGPVDLVLPVPSSTRPGAAPLVRVPGLAALAVSSGGVGGRWAPSALGRAEGVIGHMQANAAAFAVPAAWRPAVNAARVLLLDDTYVSGSRGQSAATALRRAGARSVLIAPLGRVVRPDRSGWPAALLEGPDAGAAPCLRCRRPQTSAGSR